MISAAHSGRSSTWMAGRMVFVSVFVSDVAGPMTVKDGITDFGEIYELSRI
jgi:hypothetical protein